MRTVFRLSTLLGLIVLLAAIGYLIRLNAVRTEHVRAISSLTQTAPLPLDAASPTGYAGGIRQLIVPEHNNESYQWLAQTQLMLTHGEWRLRHVDYDNAPDGREVRTPSPYRWWLGLVTWVEQQRTGLPMALAVEQAALTADPSLQIVLLTITVIFIAWQFGTLAASLLCLGLALLFPFSSAFLPGQPSDYGLSLMGALWSVLPLLVGLHTGESGTPASEKTRSRWFFLAGVTGGLALWISITKEAPILFGIALGGTLAAGLTRREPSANCLPWRAWALGGACTTLATFLIEYFPAHLELKAWRLETIHPLYAIAWLSVGELLVRVGDWMNRGKAAWNRRRLVTCGLALLGVAAVPIAVFLQHEHAWLTADALASRLTNLPNGAVAANVINWFSRDHLTAAILATLAPLLLLGPAVWLLSRGLTPVVHRISLAIVLGPLVVALGFACAQLRWWQGVDTTLLGVIVAVSAALGVTGRYRWLWVGLVALVLAPGILQLQPDANASAADAVTESEVIALVERDLAHWLANRVGPDGAIVLAPPNLTTSLYFHGGLRGLGSPYADNKNGFAAAVRLAAASSADEAQALVRKRNVTHIVMPTWDPFLDDYARLASNQPEHTLVSLLHQWQPPRWLKPIPYHLPQIAGFEGQFVAIFEVVDVQDNITALSSLAEYFAEMGLPDQAAGVARALEQSYPSDLGALVAQAQVSIALRDGSSFNKILNAIMPHLSEDEAQGLAWDRRVSLAIILAEGKRSEPAREQVDRCLQEMDEHLMRSLSPVALYRLQILSKAFGLEITEPTLRTLARNLLPPEMRSAL